MKTEISNKNLYATYEITGSASRWILPESVLIYSDTGAAISETSAHADNRIDILGQAISVDSDGIMSEGASTDTHVFAQGAVVGFEAGIRAAGASQSIFNLGTITGRQVGVQSEGEKLRLENDGTINGETGVAFGDYSGKVINGVNGTISGTTAIQTATLDGATVRIENTGLIKGVTAYEGDGAGRDVIINEGTIKGKVLLGDGNDVFNTIGGTFTGTVDGGAGDDIYWVARKNITISEDSGFDSQDLVKSTVSYTLGTGIEQLKLLGTDDLRGIGNSRDNTMTGNDGANVLDGRKGDDTLIGGLGDDDLTGGKGSDTFVFVRGCGEDTVTDYNASQDHIDLSGYNGISSYADLLKSHVSEVDGDLVISAGPDEITLVGIDKSDLSKSQFEF